MTNLTNYGWDNFRMENPAAIPQELAAGRVISIKGFKYILITEAGETETELAGKLLYAASSEELPKTGDWVLFKRYDTTGYIIDVLPRKNMLARRNPGKQTERQILATNIDAALIVQGLDQNFNTMRLERYLVQLAACNIPCVVILNKSDLITDQQFYIDSIAMLKHDCRIFFCSTYTGGGMDVLWADVLVPGKTFVLIGSSGVGKSSLLNYFKNDSRQETASVSESNSKGKHTTTTRDLFMLPNESMLIDTPGMREFGVTAEEGGAEDQMFPAISEFASQCRFSDCSHVNETGCEVLAALHSGELDQHVYNNYLKLIREQQRFNINAEDKKRMNKQAGKMSREASKHRGKYKG